MTKRIFEWLELVLGIDLRSLALFRVLLGGVILYDLITRFRSLEAHYSDSGIVTRTVLRGISENPVLLSFNMLSGSTEWQVVIFLAAAVFALLFTVGYRTKLSTIMCALLLLSIHVRNPFVNNLGDWFLLNLLIWSTLLPLGAVFSLDARKKSKYHFAGITCLSVASMGILLQVILLYYFSVFYKISPIWHTEASAIYYALSLDRLVTNFGESVISLPGDWLAALTKGTLLLERWGPLFLFVPFFTVSIRLIITACFVVFHIGLMLTLELGIFPFVCIAAWVLFIPGQCWDLLVVRIRAGAESLAKPPASLSINWVETFFATVLLLIMFSSNMLHSGKMDVVFYEKAFRYVEPLANSLNLRQRWNMFSPHPSKQDGWFVIAGVRENGSLINLVDGGKKVDWRRPDDISSTYENQRWRKNFEWVMMRWDPHARLVANYMLEDWNSMCEEADRIDHVLVFFMTEYTQSDYQSTPVERKLLYTR